MRIVALVAVVILAACSQPDEPNTGTSTADSATGSDTGAVSESDSTSGHADSMPVGSTPSPDAETQADAIADSASHTATDTATATATDTATAGDGVDPTDVLDAQPEVETETATDTATDTATEAATDTATEAATDSETATATDTATDTETATDTATDTGSDLSFPKVLHGTWLIGWVGGLNHLSWARFSGPGFGGKALYNPGKNLMANAPYWNCLGEGQWQPTAKPNTVQLIFPKSCNHKGFVFTLEKWGPNKSWPKAAILSASLTGYDVSSGKTQPSMMAWKFTDSSCDATLSTCKDVLK